MDKKFVCLFVCLAFVGLASALDCYDCTKELCEKDQSQWEKKENCGNTKSENHTPICLKTIYKDKETSKNFTIRQCTQASKDAQGKIKYECSPLDGNLPVGCETCTSNYCNSGFRTKIGFFSVAVAALFAAVPAFL